MRNIKENLSLSEDAWMDLWANWGAEDDDEIEQESYECDDE